MFGLDGAEVGGWLLKSLPYVAGLLLFIYLLVGGILDYHWRRYGVGILRLTYLRVAYVAAGIILFGVLFVALFAL